jgi:hypothetical protein
MAKLIVALGIALVLYKMLRGRWPWQPSPQTVSRAKMKACALLGVGPGAGREEIIDAHRRLIAQVHPDRGGTNDLVHEANSARDLLLGELSLGSAEQR